MDIKELEKILQNSWSKETAYPKSQKEWLQQNRSLGQCAVTALLVQEVFGGEIVKNHTHNHIWNIIDGKEIDLTINQFPLEIQDQITTKEETTREKELNNPNTKERYFLLKNNFIKSLQETEDYLFHGSSEKINILEPRQAYNAGKPDGKPAVFASHETQIPIFMSLFDPKNGEGITCGYNEGVVHLAATPSILDRVKNENVGYVHVFKKNKFTHHEGNEWVSYTPTKPDLVLSVSLRDIEVPIKEIKKIK